MVQLHHWAANVVKVLLGLTLQINVTVLQDMLIWELTVVVAQLSLSQLEPQWQDAKSVTFLRDSSFREEFVMPVQSKNIQLERPPQLDVLALTPLLSGSQP